MKKLDAHCLVCLIGYYVPLFVGLIILALAPWFVRYCVWVNR